MGVLYLKKEVKMGAPLGNCNAAKNKSACLARVGKMTRNWGKKYNRLHTKINERGQIEQTKAYLGYGRSNTKRLTRSSSGFRKTQARIQEFKSIRNLRAVREGHESVSSVRWARKYLGIK